MPAYSIRRGPELPANPRSGKVFIKNAGASQGLYVCLVDGTWVGPLSTGGEAGGSFEFETPTGAVNGTNDEFVFSSAPIFVTYQGVIQDLTVDYTLAGSTATFVVPPVSGTVKGLVSA